MFHIPRRLSSAQCGAVSKGVVLPTYVIAFESTHAAMAADDALHDIGRAMIPTPRQITASCGMALRLEASNDEDARVLVARLGEAASLARLYKEEPSEDGSLKHARYLLL